MKTIFVLAHFVGGDIVEEIASFDLDKVKARAKEIEDKHAENYERMENGELDDEIWVRQTDFSDDDDCVYKSYDQYIQSEGFDDEQEIFIRKIKFIG